MASHSEPRILVYKADGAIPKGSAVKIGSDSEHVVVGSANTDDCVGVAQNAVTAAEDLVEVALPGGGGKGLAGESITAGKLLVSHTDGSLVQTNASADRVIGMALEDASADDVFAIEVMVAVAVGADD
jgi:hypothetical protein